MSKTNSTMRKIGSSVLGMAILGGGMIAGAPAALAADKLANPLDPKTYRYSSEMGPRCIPTVGGSTLHMGQDLAGANGDRIFSVDDGVVTHTVDGTNSTSGYIVIRHIVDGKIYHMVYVHMWDANKYVKVGQSVYKGQRIADMGSSGPSTAPHLHFEVWQGAWYTGKALEPVDFMKAHGVDIKANAYLVYKLTTPSLCTYYAYTDLNFREDASSSSKTIRTVKRGEQIFSKPGTKINGYIPVTIGGVSGWVFANAVTPTRPAVITPSPGKTSTTPVSSGTVAKTSGSKSGTYNATTNVNMRSGPGTSNSIVTIVPKGAAVTGYGTNDGWRSVIYNGKIGWISGTYLDKQDAPAPKPEPKPEPKPTVVATKQVTTDLNMREGAGTTHKIITILKKDTKVSVLKTSGTWSQVKVGSKTGWVSNTYLKTVATPAPVVKTVTKQVKENLNMREGAGTTHKVITVLKKGSKVTVLKTSGTWSQVKVGSKTGWVSSAYLVTVSSSASVTTTESSANKTVTKKTTANLNMRKGASTKKAIVTVIKKGTKVTVLKTSGSWSQVKVGSKTGWVANSYIK